MKALTKKQLLNSDLTHDKGGNGWMMVEDIDGDYCRVMQVGPGKLEHRQAFLAAKDRLSVTLRRPRPGDPEGPNNETKEIPIVADVLEELNELRARVASGELVIDQTRYRKAQVAARAS